jgi:hypothetical protein
MILLVIGVSLGAGGCAEYYGAYPAYGRGYYASNYYAPAGGYYGYNNYPYGYNRYPYYGGYGAPYGYGGASVVITNGRYRDGYGRWHERGDRPRQDIRANTQVRNNGRVQTRRPVSRPVREVPQPAIPQPVQP